MADLIAEILGFMLVAAVLGVLIGYLIWGLGRRAALAAARAEGMRAARTSVDGSEPLRGQLDAALEEKERLKAEIARLRRTTRDIGDFEDVASEEVSQPGFAESHVPALKVAVVNERREPDADVWPGTHQAAQSPPAPASLLAEAPPEPDDLKLIKGVGPKMEKILNDKGVYLFQQIANFSPADVAWVNEAIEAFPGRIERDRWVEQAQVLYREMHGRTHAD